MSDLDLTSLQPAIGEYIPLGRAGLLPALQAAQRSYGYLPEPVAAEVARLLGVPLADVFGVIDFYSMLYRQPVGKTIVRVCTDPACALAGGEALLDALCRRLGVSPDEPGADGSIMVERAPCLGLCEHAPAVLVGDRAVGEAADIDPDELLSAETPLPGSIMGGHGLTNHDLANGQTGDQASDLRILTANCGKGSPTSLVEYIARGGYAGLKQALGMAPEAVIAQVKASGLVGRGGAAFPTGVKWEGAANADGAPKYMVCNADESEPGTFKDRVLLEEDPQRVLEGMLIAAYAISAEQGYLYIRGEYPHAYRVMQEAVDQARQAGYLGTNILGSGFNFDVELRQGAGAYICGEETALFESIEGKRGFPRIKPPFPTTHGLFGKPTAINNVETLCNVPYILEHGPSAYRQIGTEKSPGPKLFCVSGDVTHPGLYEVPFGITIRHLVYDLAGGVRDGRALQTILFGGAAGAFATPDQLDVHMSFEDLRQAGLPLGSGVVMVFDERRDPRDVLARLGRFFAHESCGKCYPCQLGTQRQYEILSRLKAGKPLPGDAERLADVGWTMTDASLCGLGQTAATAVLSAMKVWPELFRG
jgi:NADH-quinone oxidoreductase subunit F